VQTKRLKGECKKKRLKGECQKKKAQGGVQKKKAQGGVQKGSRGSATQVHCEPRTHPHRNGLLPQILVSVYTHLAFWFSVSKFEFWCLEKKSTLMGESRNPMGNAFGLIARDGCGNEILDSPMRLDFFFCRQNPDILSGCLKHDLNRVY
jgi:hypothetical protein